MPWQGQIKGFWGPYAARGLDIPYLCIKRTFQTSSPNKYPAMPQRTLKFFREKHRSSLFSEFWQTMFCKIHTSLCCAGPVTTVKPHTFCKLTDKSKLKAVGYLMKPWPIYSTDPKETFTPWLWPPLQGGHCLGWHCCHTVPQISHMKGEWMNRRPYQKGLVGDTGGEFSRHCADRAEPSEGDVWESSPPHATAVVGDFKCTSLMVIQTTSWKKKIKNGFCSTIK